MTEQTAVKALVKAQKAMGAAIKGTENEFFRSKYADLGAVQDACFPALHDNGFAVMHTITNNEVGSFLDTTLLHESGGSWTCSVQLMVDKSNMQALGSAITYARRYGLLCLSGVAPEDDDGNIAAASPPKNKPAATNDDIDRAITTIGNINDLAELVPYWKTLNEEQPAVVHDQRVIAAKDERKAQLENSNEV